MGKPKQWYTSGAYISPGLKYDIFIKQILQFVFSLLGAKAPLGTVRLSESVSEWAPKSFSIASIDYSWYQRYIKGILRIYKGYIKGIKSIPRVYQQYINGISKVYINWKVQGYIKGGGMELV